MQGTWSKRMAVCTQTQLASLHDGTKRPRHCWILPCPPSLIVGRRDVSWQSSCSSRPCSRVIMWTISSKSYAPTSTRHLGSLLIRMLMMTSRLCDPARSTRGLQDVMRQQWTWYINCCALTRRRGSRQSKRFGTSSSPSFLTAAIWSKRHYRLQIWSRSSSAKDTLKQILRPRWVISEIFSSPRCITLVIAWIVVHATITRKSNRGRTRPAA
mmetsp:Transcript_20273/g.34969  ORF Transcript_20273/g.34969 Transcript_20273/m.34969 type:complete len:212 (+) Transcript_20273:1318-1953(+)